MWELLSYIIDLGWVIVVSVFLWKLNKWDTEKDEQIKELYNNSGVHHHNIVNLSKSLITDLRRIAGLPTNNRELMEIEIEKIKKATLSRMYAINGDSKLFTCWQCGKEKHIIHARARAGSTTDLICRKCVEG